MIARKLTFQSIPLGWEISLQRTWSNGLRVPTEYDLPEEDKCRDLHLTLEITDPAKEPRIHKGFYGRFEDLEKYRLEMLYGVHDHWIKKGEAYTYHDRLRVSPIDQINQIAVKLRETPYSRRCVATAWRIDQDFGSDEAACLQNMQFRVLPDEHDIPKLCLFICIRSNDAFKAAFYNIYAFTEMQKLLAHMLGYPVGGYIHTAYSYHIYGKDFKQYTDFCETGGKRPIAEHFANTNDMAPLFISGCEELMKEDDMPSGKKYVIEARMRQLQMIVSEGEENEKTAALKIEEKKN